MFKLKTFFPVTIGLFLIASSVVLAAVPAGTPPACDDPNNLGCYPPINVSTANQIKPGGLGIGLNLAVNGLTTLFGVNGATALRVGPASGLFIGQVPKVTINNTNTSNAYDQGLFVQNAGQGWSIYAKGPFGIRSDATSNALWVEGPVTLKVPGYNVAKNKALVAVDNYGNLGWGTAIGGSLPSGSFGQTLASDLSGNWVATSTVAVFPTSLGGIIQLGLIGNTGQRNITERVEVNAKSFASYGTSNFYDNVNFTKQIKIKDGYQYDGRVLVSDANGNASWKSPDSFHAKYLKTKKGIAFVSVACDPGDELLTGGIKVLSPLAYGNESHPADDGSDAWTCSWAGSSIVTCYVRCLDVNNNHI